MYWVTGSATEKNIRSMPMPAANSIAAQLIRLNSGGLLRPELDRTEARSGDKHHEHDVQRRRQQVVPTEGGRHPIQRAGDPLPGEVGEKMVISEKAGSAPPR